MHELRRQRRLTLEMKTDFFLREPEVPQAKMIEKENRKTIYFFLCG